MKTSAKRRRQRRRAAQVAILGVAALAAVLLTYSGNPALFSRLSALVFDFYQNARPRPEAGAPIAIIDVDDQSIRALGQWPWPRSEIARMVDRLGELGAAAIAFDLVFSEPDRTSLRRSAEALEQVGARVDLPADLPDNDEVLGQAFQRNGVTAGFVLTNEYSDPLPPAKTGFAYAGDDPAEFLYQFRGGLSNLPVLTEAAAGLGFFSFPPTADGVVRSVPLVARGAGQLYPALSIEALRTAQGAGSIIIRATGASGEAATGRSAMTALKVGALEAPTGPAGDFRVYYSGIPSVPRVSAAALLAPDAAAGLGESISGRITLIGSSAIGLRDIIATPLSVAVPGVEVHAEIIDQILSGTFLTRPDWAPGAEIAVAILVTLLLIAALLAFGPIYGGLATLAIAAGAITASWFAFTRGQLVLDPILPGTAVLAVYVTVTAFLLLVTDRERQFVRRAFSQYLAPSLVERLADDPQALALGGETREITLLFSDIRGFTSLSEKLDPQAITSLLNRFLTPMTDVLLQSGATIDKYIGDAIMAFWNAPLTLEGHERRACLAALGMFTALEELNKQEAVTIKIGVGLNTGICCVGNLGSEQRFSYSAIGDSVNVAARVEGLTKQYGVRILMTEMTAANVKDLALLEIDRVRVVGRSEPVAIFTLLGDASFATEPDFQKLAPAHGEMLAAYRRRDFACAAEALPAVRELAPDYLAPFYEMYAKRLANLAATPPAEDWDGVFNVIDK